MSKLSAARPSRATTSTTTAEAPHVSTARAAVADEGIEKPLKILAHPRYHKAVSELKTCSSDSVPIKYFVMEAIDDLLEKYKAGKGKFSISDVAELKRRLENI